MMELVGIIIYSKAFDYRQYSRPERKYKKQQRHSLNQ